MTDPKSVPSGCLARSFEFCDLQHEQSLQEQLLTGFEEEVAILAHFAPEQANL